MFFPELQSVVFPSQTTNTSWSSEVSVSVIAATVFYLGLICIRLCRRNSLATLRGTSIQAGEEASLKPTISFSTDLYIFLSELFAVKSCIMNRFNALDVRAEVGELKSVLGMRVANIHDVGPKTYMLKLHDAAGPQHLLIEAGSRVHLTDYAREKPAVPSAFTTKLRRAVRTKRITAIEQLGIDRAIDFTLGSPPVESHVIVEFYSKGNVIVTDSDYIIQAVLRVYKDEAKGVVVAVGERYEKEEAATFRPLTLGRLKSLILQEQHVEEDEGKGEEEGERKEQESSAQGAGDVVTMGPSGQKVKKTKAQQRREARQREFLAGREQAKKGVKQQRVKQKIKKTEKLRDVLGRALPLGMHCVDHCIEKLRLSPNVQARNVDLEQHLQPLLLELQKWERSAFVEARKREGEGKGEGEIVVASAEMGGYLYHTPNARVVRREKLRQPKKSAAEMQGVAGAEANQAPAEEEPMYSHYSPLPFDLRGLIRVKVMTFLPSFLFL